MEYSNHQGQPTRESSSKEILKPQTPSSDGFHLPIEITSNILSRLPVPTVLLFRLVCKAWSHLTRTDSFIQQHLENFGKKEKDYGSVYIRNDFFEYTLFYCSNGHFRSVKIDEISPEWFYISNSCHGLVCVYNQDISIVTIRIINPAIDDNFVELPDVGMTKSKVLNVCLCYDDQANNYKAVRFYCSSNGKGMGIEVLTLGDTTWRQVGEIGEIPTGFTDVVQFASGAMHWKAYGEKIFFFKTTEETFGFIESPDVDADDDDMIMRMRKQIDLTVYEGCLCFVTRHWHPWKLKFFVMEDYVHRVWIEYVIDLMKMDETPFSDINGFDHCSEYRSIKVQRGKFLLDNSPRYESSPKKKLYYYNPKTESFENCDDTQEKGYQYKESFVSASKFCNEEI
ncbi:hypothetical protein LUZ62_031187 [Rhynchospora pubera]|uniref:F-box domain-containing protein n=1 Tax=Rhynchospora pubera TaxID=906938 RepID=A0AAV8HTR4_9POAL|nr:hypothetical protein LUZ62_031187 [Rhynchospora pubera]